jgi:IS5 family transposase
LIVNRVFANFDHWTRGELVRLQELLSVPTETTIGWHRHWLRDTHWRPYEPNLSVRRRLFTDEQEAQLAEEIRVEYVSKGYIVTDADFRLIAFEAYYRWNSINADDEVPSYRQFMTSNGFTHLFKKQNRFSSRRLHFKRRSRLNPELEE